MLRFSHISKEIGMVRSLQLLHLLAFLGLEREIALHVLSHDAALRLVQSFLELLGVLEEPPLFEVQADCAVETCFATD